jgi:hypothetical protein
MNHDDDIVNLADHATKVWTRNTCVGSSLPHLAVDEMVQTT